MKSKVLSITAICIVYMIACVLWFGHVSRMGSERLPAKALLCYINGKRNQGRQPKKSMDSVNEDMEAKKLTVQQAMVLMWDRNNWKHEVAVLSSLE